ncbi:MAG: hypothetical protein GY749_48925 [Desulfobacteraceae bacterium]|nr:hypothetical protein [Desulfobacteraceae bacterium]
MNNKANSDLYESITSARRNFPHMPVPDFPVLDFPTPNDDRSLEETNSPQFEKNKYKPESENIMKAIIKDLIQLSKDIPEKSKGCAGILVMASGN